jgi:acyl carrier protein
MTNDDILSRLTGIFHDVFDDQTIVLKPEMTADDIPGWDSLSQVTLAVEIKHQLKVTIKTAEMGELRSVSQLAELIKARLGNAATTPVHSAV